MAELINPRQGLPAFEEAPFVARKCDEDVDLKQILVELQVQRDAQASRQLELLQEIEEELASRTTPLYFISNALLQWLLVATAFIFGTFASHGTDLQVDGNYLSVLQNQMNLVSFCQASNSSIYAHPCDEILRRAPATIAWLADKFFPEELLGAEWPWKLNPLDDFFKKPYNWYVWFIPPAATGFVAFLLTWRLYREKFQKKKASTTLFSKTRINKSDC